MRYISPKAIKIVQAKIMGILGIPGIDIFLRIITKRNPAVSVVTNNHTKNRVASRKISNEPVAIRIAL